MLPTKSTNITVSLYCLFRSNPTIDALLFNKNCGTPKLLLSPMLCLSQCPFYIMLIVCDPVERTAMQGCPIQPASCHTGYNSRACVIIELQYKVPSYLVDIQVVNTQFTKWLAVFLYGIAKR